MTRWETCRNLVPLGAAQDSVFGSRFSLYVRVASPFAFCVRLAGAGGGGGSGTLCVCVCVCVHCRELKAHSPDEVQHDEEHGGDEHVVGAHAPAPLEDHDPRHGGGNGGGGGGNGDGNGDGAATPTQELIHNFDGQEA